MMRERYERTAAACALAFACLTGVAAAQAPAPAPLQVPNPTYTSIAMEINVNRPAADVWKRVGKFCDIGEWFQGLSCVMSSGKDGELGAVRTLNGSIIEILVAKTDLSHTYTQPVRASGFYQLYHGTIEAKPTSATTTKLIYSLFFDNSNLADDAAREKDRENRRTRFMQGVLNMKTLAEGGKLPPPAPPAGRPAGGAPAPGR